MCSVSEERSTVTSRDGQPRHGYASDALSGSRRPNGPYQKREGVRVSMSYDS
ncbi:hypothetical protein BgiBS90_013789, partial [Biomphalaria glabrata]